MSKLTRWNPFRGAAGFDTAADFDDLFRSFALRPFARELEEVNEMRLDASEDERSYHVNIDIPGVKKDDIEVSIDGNKVIVRAESKREETRTSGKEIYSERHTGAWFRSFTLPQEIDGDHCEAKYDKGVLSLHLPKKSNGQTKRLPVH